MRLYRITIAIVSCLLALRCKSSPTQPLIVPGVWVTLDRTSYRFTTSTVRDTVYLTVTNASDTTVLNWWPTEVWYKSDSGWVLVRWGDGAHPSIAPHARTTKSWFFYEYDSFHPFPNGIYKIGIEYTADTAVAKAPAWRRSYSAEVSVKH